MLCFIVAFMSKARFHLLTAFCVLSAFARGDTFTLKSGEKVAGNILSETDKEMTLQISVTATIKDERVIKKADIVSVEKIAPDEQAWPALKALTLGEESLELADYAQAITKLGAFASLYPQSTHATEAKTKLGLFEAEKNRVEAGERKIAGKWLSSEQAEQEKVQIGGNIMLSRMKRFAAAAQFPEAMNIFDVLEKNYPGSAAMPDAVEIARQAVPALKLAAEQRQAQIKQFAVESAARLANTKGPEHQQLEALQKQNVAAIETAIAAVERSGAAWLPLSPANERSLAALITKCDSEISRINTLPVDKMRQSLKAVAKAKAALESNDFITAEKALTDANSAWGANEQIKRLQVKLADERQRADEATKAAELAKAAATKAAQEKLAKLKAEAEKAEAEARKAKEAQDALAAEAEAREKEESDRQSRNNMIKYSLGGIAVIALGFVAMRKKASKKVEVPPPVPASEDSPAENPPAE